MSQQEPNRKWMPLIIGLVLVLLMFGLSVSVGGGGSAVTIPLSFTYIIKVGGPSIYQAFITGGNGLPVFTESNFSRLVNIDILGSSACLTGCSNTLNPGKYNLTNSLVDSTVSNLAIMGTSATMIIPQNIVFPEPFSGGAACDSTGGVRPVFCFRGVSNIVLQGFTIDDANRMFVAGVTGDDIFASTSSSNLLVQSMTIQNASNNGISLANSNTIVTTSTITGPLPLPKINGNFGILVGGTASRVRIFLNTISGFNGSDVSGIQMATGASYVSISSNELFKNSFGISSTWGKFITLEANNIHNNYAGGILLTTGAIGAQTAGPISISGGTITDNAQEPNNDVQCNSLHCSGIILRAAKSGWDTVSITGVTIKDTQAIPTQTYDIHVFGSSSCLSVQCYSNVTITGNALGRSSSGTIINLQVAPTASWTISDNRGFNPQPKTSLTAGASPYTYTNIDGYLEQLELTNVAGLTGLTCRGTAQIIQLDGITPNLNTGDTCVFTWAVTAPTFDVLPT